jgi:hypothetical protein
MFIFFIELFFFILFVVDILFSNDIIKLIKFIKLIRANHLNIIFIFYFLRNVYILTIFFMW